MLTPIRFCENETVSLILSSFADKAQKVGVSFSVDAKLPESLTLPYTELCAVLSNGLENTCVGKVTLVDGLPKSSQDGHGFGTKNSYFFIL